MGFTKLNPRQVKDAIYVGSTSGLNAYTGVMYPEPLAYVNGEKYQVKVTTTSTGLSTFNFNSLGVKKAMVNPTSQVASNDLVAGQSYIFTYDSSLDSGSGAFIRMGGGGDGSDPGGDTYFGDLLGAPYDSVALAGEFRKSRKVITSDAIIQTDDNSLIVFESATPINFTIDQLTATTKCSFINKGTGEVTFVDGVGVTHTGVSSLEGQSGSVYPTAFVYYDTATTPLIAAGGGGGGASDWGDLGGTITDQTDLVAYVGSQISAAVTGLFDDRGNFNASVNAYPSSGGSGTAGAILKGDIWTVSVAGTMPTSQPVQVGDTIRALVDTPGNTQANWAIGQNNIKNAGDVVNTPAGNISATDVQAAINELDTEKQPIDSDLTAIAALSPSNDDIIQRKAGAWTNRTIAQLAADLGIASGWTNVTTSSSTSGNFSLDMSSSIRKFFAIGTTQTGNIVLTAISNATNMMEALLTVRITGTRTLNLNAISNVKMGREETSSVRWDTSTKILTLEGLTGSSFLIIFTKDDVGNILVSASYRYEP